MRALVGLCLAALGFVMVFQFQNCAPAPGGAASDDSSPVHAINPVNGSSALRFAYEKVQVTDASESTVLEGECDRIAEGTVVDWDVQEGQTGVTAGSVACDRGRFQVEIAPDRELECGKTYDVSARLDDGTEGRTQVEKVCAN